MVLKRSDDHWSFLEKIEAPMWVDLTLEAKPVNQDFDPDWFYRSHLFHQCSSRELKHAFSHNAVVNPESDFDLQGSSSPKLPASVSRSRGKHYISSKLGNFDLLLNKKHPVKTLSGKYSWVDSETIEEGKLKPSCENLRGPSSSITSFVCQSTSSGTAVPNYRKHIPTIGDSKASLSSAAIATCDGNSTSTIMSEGSQQQQQKFSEESSQASSLSFDRTNGLLTALRTNLRKSCVTRQASRVEVNDVGQSKGRKSSSSKSSVGSSSNFSNGVKNIASKGVRKKEQTAADGGGVVMGMSRAAKNSVKVASVSMASFSRVEDRASTSKRGGKTTVVKSTHKEAPTSKVLHQTFRGKALMQRGLNEGHPLSTATVAKDKAGVRKFNRSQHGGKENAVRRMDGSQRFCNKDGSTGCKAQDQMLTTQSALKKDEKAKLVGTKCKIKGKTQMNAAQKVYLR